METPAKHKRTAPWFKPRIDSVPFRYEIDAALEVIVHLMEGKQTWRLGVHDTFVITVDPMHPEQREHQFNVALGNAGDKQSTAVGRIFQATETTCIMEGAISITWQPLYRAALNASVMSLVVLLIGQAASANSFCVGAVILVIVYVHLIGASPSANQERLTKILRGIVDTVHSMRYPYRLETESPYPKQAPKHSRPSSHNEKVERSKPVIQQIDLRETPGPDEKSKHKRG